MQKQAELMEKYTFFEEEKNIHQKKNENLIDQIENQSEAFYDGPIDLVYTWVNGSDPVFLESLKKELKSKK